MLYTLNNITKPPQPRHAENSDTHQFIQRHDPEFERRKKKKHQPEDIMDFEDGAVLAVDALKIFLQSFLKDLGDAHQKSQNTPPKKPQNPNKTGQSAYAANAYEHAAQSQRDHSVLDHIDESNAALLSLNAADTRKIHNLIENLNKLEKQDVNTIQLYKATSFLESIENAVNTHLA